MSPRQWSAAQTPAGTGSRWQPQKWAFPNVLPATYRNSRSRYTVQAITFIRLLAPSLVHVAASLPHIVHKPKVSHACLHVIILKLMSCTLNIARQSISHISLHPVAFLHVKYVGSKRLLPERPSLSSAYCTKQAVDTASNLRLVCVPM